MNKDWVQKAILARVARSKKIRRPNLAISSFKKGQICQIWPLKRQNGNPDPGMGLTPFPTNFG